MAISVESVDVLVIGAGPAGAVAAGFLLRSDVKVLVVEKSHFPRFAIGESLLPRSMEHFEKAGFLPVLDQASFEVKKGARFIRGEEVCLFDFSKKFTAGWDWTWQVPRAHFDKCLTDSLTARGADIRFGHAVESVRIDDDGSSVSQIQGAQGEQLVVHARYIIDCSGGARVLAKILGLDRPSALPKHASIFAHVQDKRRPTGEEGSLISFDIIDTETWFWVIPFSNGTTSIGFVGPTGQLESFTGSQEDRLREMVRLSDKFAHRFEGLEFSLGPYESKNYSSAVSELCGKGFVLAGNSAEFLDPIFSSGVAFATESSSLAASLIIREMSGKNVDWSKEYSAYIKQGVEVFSTYVKEWYTGNLQKLFFHRPENEDVKEKICAVLAGYVWDDENPFVKKHHNVIKNLAHLIDVNSAV